MGASAGKPPVAVLGAGSWGTALEHSPRAHGHRTFLWGRDASSSTSSRDSDVTSATCPASDFPAGALGRAPLERALASADELLIAVPSHAFRSVARDREAAATGGNARGLGDEGLRARLRSAAEPGGHAQCWARMCRRPCCRDRRSRGKSARDLPTAMTIASRDDATRSSGRKALSSANFRAYSSADVTGVEVGGATKNVLAIGAGCSDGLGFGANTRVALITRGLAEMMRLGVALGADKDTFMGLAGLGDLVLTCTDDQSTQPPSRSRARARRDPLRRRRRRLARSSRVCSPREPCAKRRRGPRSRCRSPSRSTACSTRATHAEGRRPGADGAFREIRGALTRAAAAAVA